jgi:hypothetical protein
MVPSDKNYTLQWYVTDVERETGICSASRQNNKPFVQKQIRLAVKERGNLGVEDENPPALGMLSSGNVQQFPTEDGGSLLSVELSSRGVYSTVESQGVYMLNRRATQNFRRELFIIKNTINSEALKDPFVDRFKGILLAYSVGHINDLVAYAERLYINGTTGRPYAQASIIFPLFRNLFLAPAVDARGSVPLIVEVGSQCQFLDQKSIPSALDYGVVIPLNPDLQNRSITGLVKDLHRAAISELVSGNTAISEPAQVVFNI